MLKFKRKFRSLKVNFTLTIILTQIQTRKHRILVAEPKGATDHSICKDEVMIFILCGGMCRKWKGFNWRASCQFAAAKLGFILKLMLTTAQLMRKAAAYGAVEIHSNTVPKQCKSFPSSYRPRTTVPTPNSTPFSQLFGKLFSWIENSDWKRSWDEFAF